MDSTGSQQPSGGGRSRVAQLVGWILIAIGGLLALGSLIGGTGLGGHIGGVLMGAAIALCGAMLVRPFTSWKKAAPGAIIALVLGAVMLPSAPKEPAPASGLIGPTATATVTESATATVTVTTTMTVVPPTSTEPTTTAVASTSTRIPPNPGLTETNTRTPVPTVDRVPPPRTTTADAPSAYYSNCDEAKAAGAAPMYRGSPGYRRALDRDGDGIACDK